MSPWSRIESKYQVGDLVRVKSIEEMMEIGTAGADGISMPSLCLFNNSMYKYCDKQYAIQCVDKSKQVNGQIVSYYHLDGDGAGGWFYTDEMLDCADECTAVDNGITFEDLMG